GPFAAVGGGSVQPATTYGDVISTVGWPLTVTRGLGTVGCACPACEHITCAPTWRRKPGISRHYEGHLVDHHTRPQQFDRCTLAVGNENPCIVDDNGGPGCAPENNSAGRRCRRHDGRRRR